MSTSPIPGYLYIDEVARRLRVGYSQAAKYVQDRRLPSISVGRTKLVPEAAVQNFEKSPPGNPTFLRKPKKRNRRSA